jgi:hypothetical protein
MRLLSVVLWILLSATPAMGQVSFGIGISVPGVSIGINVPAYPDLVRVPGYPVYYAPRLGSNLFFYDGMYWVFQGDNWYASSWYNGPWGLVAPEVVPVYVLRIPVRYYRNPPPYFRGWQRDAPPRWGDHWGHDWEQHRSGWDRWDRRSAPAPAPLPIYQRQYSGNRYPSGEQQPVLHARNYRYQPHEPVVKQHYEEHAIHAPPPAQRGQQRAPVERSPRQQDARPSPPPQQERPPEQDPRRKAHQETTQGKGAAHESGRGKDQEKEREKGEDRGPERNK